MCAAGLDRINQDVDGTRFSRSGRQTFNCNVMGDFSMQVLHRMADAHASGIDRAVAPWDRATLKGDERDRARTSGLVMQISVHDKACIPLVICTGGRCIDCIILILMGPLSRISSHSFR